MDDVELSCYYPAGTIIEREVNCNSQFMLQILPEILTEPPLDPTTRKHVPGDG